MDKDLLRNIPVFSRLSDTDRAELSEYLQARPYKPYQPIFWIGENGQEMYIIQHGKVRLSYPDEAGNDITLAVLGPGHFFGELSLLDGGPRTATGRAETDTTLLILDRQGFYRFLEKHPSAALHMISVLGQRQRDSMAKLRGLRNVNQEVDSSTTTMQRLVDMAAAIGASGAFLIINILFIIVWIVVNTIQHDKPVIFHDEPPTFFWLGFMITLEAILLTMFVLNSQKRQAERDRIRADLEYQVNLKAQTDVMMLHQKVDKLLAKLGIGENDRRASSARGDEEGQGEQDTALGTGSHDQKGASH